MFGSTKKSEAKPVSGGGNGRSRVPSIISADTTLKGDLRSTGELHLEGAVEGDVQADRLVIGETAVIKGNVQADTVRVCGKLDGNVTGREVVLTATARMTGDIFHDVLTLEPGARFAGAVRHTEPGKPAPAAGVVPLRNAEPALAAPKSPSAAA
jgi:cytoskeletal protein CcmA (bactofilin family)